MAKTVLENVFADALSSISDLKERSAFEAAIKGLDSVRLPQELLLDPTTQQNEQDQSNLYAVIGEMGIPQRLKLALFGNKLARSILLRDSNKQIARLVLENGQITESEVLEAAKNTQIDEGIHRSIAANKTWMKSYQLKLAIVSNPKTPVDVSINWVKYLQGRDIAKLSKSKNIPSPLATQCKKLAEKRQK